MRSTIVRSALMCCALWTLAPSVVVAKAPTPLVATGHPVTWWVVFKFNAAAFAGCGGTARLQCTFGGEIKNDRQYGEQFAFASSSKPTFEKGEGCNGETISVGGSSTFLLLL